MKDKNEMTNKDIIWILMMTNLTAVFIALLIDTNLTMFLVDILIFAVLTVITWFYFRRQMKHNEK